MPTPRRCAGCGAALGQPTDDDLTVVCTFCGLRHDLNDLAGGANPVVVAVGSQVPRANTAIMLVVLAIVALTVGGGLYTAYRTASAVTSRVQEATASPTRHVADARRLPTATTMAELATLTGFGWHTVEAPAPPGGYDAFEPVAALPWALAIGRAWASDAVVTRIDVGRVSATGVVDLGGEATSGYRFHSPARAMRWKHETDAGSKSTTASGLMLQVQGTHVRVLVDTTSRDEPAAPAATSLPLPEILTRARNGRGFGDRPYYGGYMIHLPREGWVWYLSAPSGDSFPRVRARDGRVYPY